MNSSTAPPTKSTTAPVEAAQASTWIERVAIPLAISTMEAQPIALGIALLTVMVTKDISASPIGAGGIALVALGLLWWAMLVEHSIQRSTHGRRMAWLHFLGWFVAFVLTAGPYIPSLVNGESIPAVLIDLVLLTWFWRRGHRQGSNMDKLRPPSRQVLGCCWAS